MKRKNWALWFGGLAGLAFLAPASALWLDSDPWAGKPLLEAQLVPQLDGIKILKTDQAVTLVKGPDHWRVLELNDYPADPELVEGLLARLSQTPVGPFLTDQPQRLSELSLGYLGEPEFVGKGLELHFLRQGVAQQRMVFGSSRILEQEDSLLPESGVAVRLGSENRAYWVPLDLVLPLQPEGWGQKQLLKLQPEQLQSLTGPGWGLARPGPGEGFLNPQGIAPLAGELDGLFRVFSDLKAQKIDRHPPVGRRAAIKVKLALFDGAELAFALYPGPGVKRSEPRYWLKFTGPAGAATQGAFPFLAAQSQGWLFQIPNWQAQRLLDAKARLFP
ncbi:MAG: hypothetical protein A2600_07285 [Candidatus Lambdaproteobacteria bacterium RIFOXYD1_FULL_56_27]|uniref:DUF4340 domain-containing protein n=1 Tax=Candidatus Lambdaproteobacteria bacterium RIFOXYD2_FULL_56_26 TaxID=1817773 RepID=A0A1F6GQF7_9PROT|nr:MAG: hypothetical protein A2557_05945 [Candidatus Lambdaproteobacteria bacterium RIFOXYD2_FULL_56_26]OGH03735.1 MAG: hypothetical protein A2426_00735 [Candidatus Lambdaproteobacteria bacterium RIFOXYC1_FULL_56_13]OGH07319.1 MAG: hypothetical protein A2600_07285 [Candidatus Lambdaproteobacteria bacterium RIFOXYD1_FULL_56_27]